MARRPVWLAGIGADALGFVAQAAALAIGRLAVVQPLLIASVVFALPLGARLTGQHVGRRDVGAAVIVTAALAAFLVVANPSGGRGDAPLGEWLIAGAALRRRERPARAARPQSAAQAEGRAARRRSRDAVRAVSAALTKAVGRRDSATGS